MKPIKNPSPALPFMANRKGKADPNPRKREARKEGKMPGKEQAGKVEAGSEITASVALSKFSAANLGLADVERILSMHPIGPRYEATRFPTFLHPSHFLA